MLGASTDLGPSHRDDTQLTAALRDSTKPDKLVGWARGQGLSVRWQPGKNWAVVEGKRRQGWLRLRRRGARLPRPARSGVLRIPAAARGARGTASRGCRARAHPQLHPHHTSKPPMLPLDVPDQGLQPERAAQHLQRRASWPRPASPARARPSSSSRSTVTTRPTSTRFATLYELPKFTPTLVGGQPAEPHGETTMDLEVAHAIAPDAQKVVVNARPTVEGDGGAYEKIAQMLESADEQFPGAVWSFSIGWGCDKLVTAADLAPVRSALAAAHAQRHQRRSTPAVTSPGLECKGGHDWSSPPSDARRRTRLGRLVAGDDRRRRHHLVHRCHGRMAVRAGLVRRAAVAGQRRRGVVVVRPTATGSAPCCRTPGCRDAASPPTSPPSPTRSPA